MSEQDKRTITIPTGRKGYELLSKVIEDALYGKESNLNREPKIHCGNQACVDAVNKAFIEAGKKSLEK